MGTTLKVVEYAYDAFNRRIEKAVDTTSPFDMADAAIERYVYDDVNGVTSLDGGNVVLDFVDSDGDGSSEIGLEKRYLYGNAVDQILAQEDVTVSDSSADRVYWHLADNLGTVRDLAKNDGTLGEHYKYDSFGQVTSGDISVTRYLFTSREYDEEIDLQHNRARWYDSRIGRWISEDPLGFVANDPNLVRYVSNAPPLVIDPSGFIIITPIVFSPVLVPMGIGTGAALGLAAELTEPEAPEPDPPPSDVRPNAFPIYDKAQERAAQLESIRDEQGFLSQDEQMELDAALDIIDSLEGPPADYAP